MVSSGARVAGTGVLSDSGTIKAMKVGIVGSRGFADLSAVAAYVRGLPPGTTVVSGGAQGVDSVAEKEAERLGLATEIYRVDTVGVSSRGEFARRAHARNQIIVDVSDRLVAFWDGQSRGTADTIRRAGEASKEVEVVTI